MSTERERLIEELVKLYDEQSISLTSSNIADFIIQDRARIVDPIKEYKENILKYSGLIGWVKLDNKHKEAIDETLKRGGVEV